MIRLSRSVDVNVFEAEATVAIGRDRPEFLAVARLAADLDRPIGARDVLRELLGNRPEVVGWKVIDRCVALGLLQRRASGPASISEGGRAALEHGAVLVPEEGLWRFYFAADALLPAGLLHAERLYGDSAKEERSALKEARARGEGRPPRPDRPPRLLASCEGDVLESVARGNLFQLVKLGGGGEHADDAKLSLSLEWDSAPNLSLRGQFAPEDGAPLRVDAQVPVPDELAAFGRDRLWRTLVAHATGVSVAELERWHKAAAKPILPTRFDETHEAAMRGFARDLPIPEAYLEGLGSFDPTVLRSVPLAPATDDDAQRWFTWLQWTSITTYATPPLLEARARDLAARFPYHRPRPTTALELLERARTERGDRAWNLLAPFDLGLWS